MLALKIAGIIAAVLVALIALTFTVYFFNLDMKLVYTIYNKLKPHYDTQQKDRKL